MDKLRDKYEALGQEALDKIKLTDDAVFEISFGIVPGEDGSPVSGTWVVLTLKHNLLLGQPPIITSQPVPSMNLGADLFPMVVAKMLEDCRQERDRLNAQPLVSQKLPAGLARGKRG